MLSSSTPPASAPAESKAAEPAADLSTENFAILQNTAFTHPESLSKLVPRLSPRDAGKLLTQPFKKGQYLAARLVDLPETFKIVIARAETPAVDQVLREQTLNTQQLTDTICYSDDTVTIEKILLRPGNKLKTVLGDILKSKASEQDKQTVLGKISQLTLNKLLTSPIEYSSRPSLLLSLFANYQDTLALFVINRSPAEELRKSILSTDYMNTSMLGFSFCGVVTLERIAVLRRLIEKSELSDADLSDLCIAPNTAGRTVIVYAYGAILSQKNEKDVADAVKQFVRQVLYKLNAEQMQHQLLTASRENVNILHIIRDPEPLKRILILGGNKAFNDALLVRETETKSEQSPLDVLFQNADNSIPEFILAHTNAAVINRLLKERLVKNTLVDSLLRTKSPKLLQLFVNLASAKAFFDNLTTLSRITNPPQIKLTAESFLILLGTYPAEFKTWWSSKPKNVRTDFTAAEKLLDHAFGDTNKFVNGLESIAELAHTFKYQAAWLMLVDFHLPKAQAMDNKSVADKLLGLKYEIEMFNGNRDAALQSIEKIQDLTNLPNGRLFAIIHAYNTKLLEMQGMNNLAITDPRYFVMLDKVQMLSMTLTKRISGLGSEARLQEDTVRLCNAALARHYDPEYKTEESGISAELMQKHEAYKRSNPEYSQQIYSRHFDIMRALLARQKDQIGKSLLVPDRTTYNLQTKIYSELTLLDSDQEKRETLQAGLKKLDLKNEFRGVLKNLEADMMLVLSVKPAASPESTLSNTPK